MGDGVLRIAQLSGTSKAEIGGGNDFSGLMTAHSNMRQGLEGGWLDRTSGP